MAKSELKLQAYKLRRKGMSVGAIAKQLAVSKGSVSLWCRDVQLTDAQQKQLIKNKIKGGHAGRLIGSEMNHQKKLKSISEAHTEAIQRIKALSTRDILMLGIGLYWGEGVKASASATAMVNSDPAIILFAKRWFEECLGVESERFSPYIYISDIHRPRSKKIIRFWASHLGLPIEQFHEIVFLATKRKKLYENHDSYYGVLALRVSKGTYLKYRILGLIDACKRSVGVAQLVRASHS